MKLGLEDKVALVGGGSRGLGRAAAEALAHEGARVAIYARNRERLERAAEELRATTGREILACAGDVSRGDDCLRIVESAARHFGRLDVVVPNMAGDAYPADVVGEPDSTWLAEFELYTMSVVRICRAAVPHLRETRGSVVNISSCGVHQLIPELALSEVVRLATAGFTKQLATQLAPVQVRVNSVLPGWIAGDLIEELEDADAAERGIGAGEVRDAALAAIPMGRYGDASDVAQAIVFLASDAARYITGVNLRVDGGWAMTPTM